jgi:hypothetical protein
MSHYYCSLIAGFLLPGTSPLEQMVNSTTQASSKCFPLNNFLTTWFLIITALLRNSRKAGGLVLSRTISLSNLSFYFVDTCL